MKQATLIFVRTLAAISQNDPSVFKKKNKMIALWKKAVEDKDIGTLNDLLSEVYLSTTNDYFHTEINKCKEMLTC